MNIVDQYLGGFPWLVIGVIELVCIAWIYGKERTFPRKKKLFFFNDLIKVWIIFVTM